MIPGVSCPIASSGSTMTWSNESSWSTISSWSFVSSEIMMPWSNTVPQQIMTGTGIKLNELSIEDIWKISSTGDLFAINPAILNSVTLDNPNFVEIERNKLLVQYYLSKINDPEYYRLDKEKTDIIEWRAIWTKEVIKADDALNKMIKTNSASWDLFSTNTRDVANNREIALKKFQESVDYKNYIQENQEKLKTINESMQKYLPSEALEAQKTIESLTLKEQK